MLSKGQEGEVPKSTCTFIMLYSATASDILMHNSSRWYGGITLS